MISLDERHNELQGFALENPQIGRGDCDVEYERRLHHVTEVDEADTLIGQQDIARIGIGMNDLRAERPDDRQNTFFEVIKDACDSIPD